MHHHDVLKHISSFIFTLFIGLSCAFLIVHFAELISYNCKSTLLLHQRLVLRSLSPTLLTLY